jgi:RNA polymerase sigma factor for flagellar operon FliA
MTASVTTTTTPASMPASTAPDATSHPATDPPTAATEELVRAHLPLVGHLVRELMGRLPAHVNRDDLTSAGMMALVTYAQGFDPGRGVPFNRFATIRIRGALTDELRSMDWASRGVRTRARDIDTVTQQLTAALGRTPERSEIAIAMGVAVADLDAVEADVHRAATLSVEGLADAAGGDLVPSHGEGPEGLLVRREEVGLLHDAIAELPDRLRTVIEEYFYGNRRMADIAADLGVTESRISQLRSEALTMLRDGLRGQEGGASGPGAGSPVGPACRYDGVPGTLGGERTAGPAIPAVQVDAAGTRTAAKSDPAATTARTAGPVDTGTRVSKAGPVDTGTRVGKAGKPSRREAARQAYVAAIASRSTLATRLAATTTLGETRAQTAEGLRAAQ